MTLDFTSEKEVKVDMRRCVKDMLEEFPELGMKTATTPVRENLFNVNKSPELETERAELFHTFVVKNFSHKKGKTGHDNSSGFPMHKRQEAH